MNTANEMSKNREINPQFRVYCEPKNGAEGGPHYLEDEFYSQESAEAKIEEMLEDGTGKYWKLSVRPR